VSGFAVATAKQAAKWAPEEWPQTWMFCISTPMAGAMACTRANANFNSSSMTPKSPSQANTDEKSATTQCAPWANHAVAPKA
jgi:hypothetical protein